MMGPLEVVSEVVKVPPIRIRDARIATNLATLMERKEMVAIDILIVL